MKQFTLVSRDVVRGGPRTLVLGDVGPAMDGVAALTKGLRAALDNGYILLPGTSIDAISDGVVCARITVNSFDAVFGKTRNNVEETPLWNGDSVSPLQIQFPGQQLTERLIKERDKLRAELEQMRDDATMACECPRENCDCAGCSYARERSKETP